MTEVSSGAGGRYVMCPHHSGPMPSLCVLAVVQSISPVQLSATPWTAAHQALLSSTVSWSLLKLMSIDSWCYLTLSFSVAPFSFCLQSFPASGSFPMSWLFTSGGQSIGVSASASVLPMSTQGWFPLGLTDLISLQSKTLSSTTIQKHQFFSNQPSLCSNSNSHKWLYRPLSAMLYICFLIAV